MADFRLGIIGSGMAYQSDVHPHEPYHRLLAGLLDANEDIQLCPTVVQDFDKSPAERVERLLQGSAIDGVLFHLQPRFVQKALLITAKADPENGGKRFAFHPFLFSRQVAGERAGLVSRNVGNEAVGNGSISPQPAEESRASTRLRWLHFHNLNMIAGRLAGLWSWAIDDELRQVEGFISTCEAHGLPFVVLGSWPRVDSPLSSFLCARLNRLVAARVAQAGAPFCSFGSLGRSEKKNLLGVDGVHLTDEGHRAVAGILHPAMGPWMQARLSRRRHPDVLVA